jgi:hypothetical protein
VGRLRGRLARLLKEAGKGAVVLEQRDGTRRYFSEMAVLREKFLAECDLLIRGEPPKDSSGVISAVLGATDRSRQEFERRFGRVVGMEARIVASAQRGGWAETYTLLADGTVEKIRYEGEEAERIRLEARCADAPGSRGVSDLSE